jgi:anti-anti-sigma factor
MLVLHPPVARFAPDPGQLLSVTTLPSARAGRVVIEVVGEVDTYTAPVLEACLRSQVTRRGLRQLVVDLRRVTFLGAAGVAVLARAQRRCRMRDARLVLRTTGRRSVLRTLRLTGLADLVDVDAAEVDSERPRGPRTGARPRTRPRRAPAQRPPRVCR